MGGEQSTLLDQSGNLEKQMIVSELKDYVDERLNKTTEKQRRELERCREAYDILYTKYDKLLTARTAVEVVKSKISDEAIDSFVTQMMADPHTNMYGFPDVVESAIYRKLLKTTLGAVAHAADSTEIRFMGHKITFTIEPVNELGDNDDPEASIVSADM